MAMESDQTPLVMPHPLLNTSEPWREDSTFVSSKGFIPGMKAGSYAHFGVREENEGERVHFFTDQDSATTGEELSPEVETIYLRSDIDFDKATFAWSLDGETWKQIAHTTQLTLGSWRGNRPGLFCWNARTDDPTEAGWVDVDWFRVFPLGS